jgi:hypothetical protein
MKATSLLDFGCFTKTLMNSVPTFSWIVLISGFLNIGSQASETISPPLLYGYEMEIYPDISVVFGIAAQAPCGAVTFELLSAPSNVVCVSDYCFDGRGEAAGAAVDWNTPSHTELGTTNVFVFRCYYAGNAFLSSTAEVRAAIIDLPKATLCVSNGTSVLEFTNLLPTTSYYLEWTSTLPSTTWHHLTEIGCSHPRQVTVIDPTPATIQRFYRILPLARQVYLGSCP